MTTTTDHSVADRAAAEYAVADFNRASANVDRSQRVTTDEGDIERLVAVATAIRRHVPDDVPFIPSQSPDPLWGRFRDLLPGWDPDQAGAALRDVCVASHLNYPQHADNWGDVEFVAAAPLMRATRQSRHRGVSFVTFRKGEYVLRDPRPDERELCVWGGNLRGCSIVEPSHFGMVR